MPESQPPTPTRCKCREGNEGNEGNQHHEGTLIPIAQPHPAIWQEKAGVWWCCAADYPDHEPSCEYHEARDYQ
jgi:hypothetical protein